MKNKTNQFTLRVTDMDASKTAGNIKMFELQAWGHFKFELVYYLTMSVHVTFVTKILWTVLGMIFIRQWNMPEQFYM